jgi:predicted enzyme related to lactoylglutathione lyase
MVNVNGVSHIYFPVRDVNEAIEFYTTKLGLTLRRKWRQNDRESAYLETAGVLLELTQSDKTPSTDDRFEPRIGLAVPNLEEAIEDLRAGGVEIAREPWQAATFYGRQAMIKDPSGWVISLREWRQPDGPKYTDWKPEREDVVRTA